MSKTANYSVHIILIINIIFSTNTFAESAAKEDLMSENTINSQFKSRQDICENKKGHVREVCIVEAKGDRDIATAKLKAKMEPTLEHEVDYRIAIAEAKYSLSVKKCQTSKFESTCTDKAQALKDAELEDARAVRN